MSRLNLPTEIPPGGVMLEGTPYRLLAVLGAGGQGIAYKVANTAAGGRFECLKVLLNVRERELVERFLRERDTIAVLGHKAIVQMITSFWLPDGRPAFTMEFVDGLSVKQMLAGGRPLSVRQAVMIASEVADGLAAAHAKGFIHRDIKPANIIVGHDGTVKIIDFGVAKVLQVDPNSPEEKLTINPGLIGTMVYASPEMLWRFVATPESDLYSLGLVLYEMLTGKRPFRAGSAVELAELMRTTQPPTLAAAGQGGPFPDQLEWAVRSLLKANVDERTRTAREVRRQLEVIRRMLPNDAQIEVNADARADDVTVASTVVGSYPDAIAATGPAPAAMPIVRSSSPSYPSSVPTVPNPAVVADEGTVPSNAFRAVPPSVAPRPAPVPAAAVVASSPRSILPWVIVVVVILASAGTVAAVLLTRSPVPSAAVPSVTTANSTTTATATVVAVPTPTALATPPPSSAAPAPTPSAEPSPSTVAKPAGPSAGIKPKPTAATGTVASQPTAAAPIVTTTPPPPPVTPPPTPSPKPPPGGAMDDRL